jgi:hypothetical protein
MTVGQIQFAIDNLKSHQSLGAQRRSFHSEHGSETLQPRW